MPAQTPSSQFDKALMELRELVLSGAFPSGARMREVALADQLGISRTPLRQAMLQLIDEGLLERIETGGCRVARFTMEDIVDAIEIRGVIEGTAARLACERGIDDQQAEKMEEVLLALDVAVSGHDDVDFDAYIQNNSRFHILVGELAGSAMIRREIDRVSRLPLASPSAFLQGQQFIPDFQASLRLAQAQHWTIFDAIRNREGSRAEAMVREHARLARKNLEYVTRAQPNLAVQVPGLSLVAN